MKTTVAALLGMLLTTSAFAAPITLTVAGTSDMWLAGAPNGTQASGQPAPPPPPLGVDFAPAQSPAEVTFSAATFLLTANSLLKFEVTGGVLNTPDCPALGTCNGPDGGAFTTHIAGYENGISNINAPVNSLLGVFLDANVPSGVEPSMFDFSLGLGTNFILPLQPVLRQVFFIGDGNNLLGDQQFVVPVGATRLFLGTMDGYEWHNNSGAFEVTVDTIGQLNPEILDPVPEPATLTLLGLGLGLVARRSLKKKARG